MVILAVFFFWPILSFVDCLEFFFFSAALSVGFGDYSFFFGKEENFSKKSMKKCLILVLSLLLLVFLLLKSFGLLYTEIFCFFKNLGICKTFSEPFVEVLGFEQNTLFLLWGLLVFGFFLLNLPFC